MCAAPCCSLQRGDLRRQRRQLLLQRGGQQGCRLVAERGKALGHAEEMVVEIPKRVIGSRRHPTSSKQRDVGQLNPTFGRPGGLFFVRLPVPNG